MELSWSDPDYCIVPCGHFCRFGGSSDRASRRLALESAHCKLRSDDGKLRPAPNGACTGYVAKLWKVLFTRSTNINRA